MWGRAALSSNDHEAFTKWASGRLAFLEMDVVAGVIRISSHAEDDLAELVSASLAVGFLAKSDLSAEAVAALVANER